MAKEISEIPTSVDTTTSSEPTHKATPSVDPRNIDQNHQRVPINLAPIPESTASLRQNLKEKRRQHKQREKQKKQAQRLKTKRKSHRPFPQRSRRQVFDISEKTVADQLAAPSSLQRTVARQKSSDRWRSLKRLGVALGIVGVACGGGWIALEVSLPDTTQLASATSMRAGTLTLKSADGVILFQSGPASRQTVKIAQIPQQLQDAFIATEDRRFFEHDGIDGQGILRAMVTNVLSGELAEGGSTITQQLSRITYLDQERSILRKLKEARLSQKIEAKLSKPEILERYLNQVYLGSGAYGIADAAWVYFGKSLDQLNLQESATLAGLPAAPSLYSPLHSPKVAKERRDLVLDRMLRTRAITPQAAATAKKSPVVLNAKQSPSSQDHSPYFSAYVQDQLPRILSDKALKQGGLTIETTLNSKWQKAATTAIQNAVYHTMDMPSDLIKRH